MGDKKRDLSARAPKRDGIGRESKWEKQEAEKKKEMIASSKRRKVKQDGVEEVKAKKPRIEGEGNANEIKEHSSRNPKEKTKKSKKNVGKENEVKSSGVKSVKKKKKKQPK